MTTQASAPSAPPVHIIIVHEGSPEARVEVVKPLFTNQKDSTLVSYISKGRVATRWVKTARIQVRAA